jgi:hypothetical protein
MRSKILPAATSVYADAARGLVGRYEDATAPAAVRAVAITALVALATIVLAHVYVTWRSRRWLNAGMLVAAAVLVGAAAATWSAMGREADALSRSRDEGAELVTTLSTARILTLRALSDENLDLIEHGTDRTYMTDFETRVRSLGIGAPDGLTDRAARAAPDPEIRRGVAALDERYDAYLAAHADVRAQTDGADHQALMEAVDRGTQAARAVDDELDHLIDASATTLRREADGAGDLAVLVPIIVITTLIGAAAVVLGLRPRLREYR